MSLLFLIAINVLAMCLSYLFFSGLIKCFPYDAAMELNPSALRKLINALHCGAGQLPSLIRGTNRDKHLHREVFEYNKN